MAPVYKGSTFELQPGKYDWEPGKGWRGLRMARGAFADVAAEAEAMKLYCKKIHIEVGTDYSEATGSYDGQADGGDDDTSRGEAIWEIEYNEAEITILDAIYATTLEGLRPGAIAVIQKAFDAFKKMDSEDVTGLYTPANFSSVFTVADHLTRAENIFHRLISGVTHVQLDQPVLLFSSTYGRQFTGKKPIPGQPTIYATTAALSAALPIPADVLFELPDGAWKEKPPRVRRTNGERTEISQRWEWFSSIDTVVAYPQ